MLLEAGGPQNGYYREGNAANLTCTVHTRHGQWVPTPGRPATGPLLLSGFVRDEVTCCIP